MPKSEPLILCADRTDNFCPRATPHLEGARGSLRYAVGDLEQAIKELEAYANGFAE